MFNYNVYALQEEKEILKSLPEDKRTFVFNLAGEQSVHCQNKEQWLDHLKKTVENYLNGNYKMKVIVVSSQLCMGKDVLCDYLAEKLQDNWGRGAFADSVKNVFMKSFCVDREFIEKWKRNPEPPPGMLQSVRKSLQFIGDGFRTIQDNIWIEIALKNELQKIIFSDGRYINEAKAVKAKGGLSIALYRPGFLNDDPNPSESQIRPIIEWLANNREEGPILKEGLPENIENYDYFIKNDGTLEDLYKKIDDKLIPYVLSYFNS